tara:strand:- start:3 stop:191 length:189 start_codon:yes stop_codon:yes gene_type:complete
MFKGCTIKYNSFEGVNQSIQITYPADDQGIVYAKSVPLLEGNRDYADIQQWVAEGNTIEEAD